jgi:hypothetical protein
LWIDDFKIQKTDAAPRPRREQRSRDELVLQTGDELFGALEGLTAKSIAVAGAFGSTRTPWAEVVGLRFRREPIAARPVTGWIARIELQAAPGALPGDCDWLVGALQSADEKTIALEHAWLGRLEFDPSAIRRLEPLFLGTRLEIEPAVSHLGDEIREEFRCPVPDGPRLERTFRLAASPAGPAFIRLETDNLEPAGPKTPAWSEFLTDLRAGHLLTEVFVNEQRVDDLNRHLDSRLPASRPGWLRIAVPAKLLKAGENRIRLEQRPARNDPRNFDDCELSNITLEIEEPAPGSKR